MLNDKKELNMQDSVKVLHFCAEFKLCSWNDPQKEQTVAQIPTCHNYLMLRSTHTTTYNTHTQKNTLSASCSLFLSVMLLQFQHSTVLSALPWHFHVWNEKLLRMNKCCCEVLCGIDTSIHPPLLSSPLLSQGKVRPQAETDCVQHLSNQLRRHRRHRRITNSQQHRAALRRIRQLQQTVGCLLWSVHWKV